MNRFLAVICIGFLTLGSCSDNRPVLFNMEMEADLTIPAGLDNFLTHHFVIQNVPTFSSIYLQNVSRDQIVEINGRSARLTGNNQTVNWGVIEEVTLNAVSRSTGKRAEMFFQNMIPFDKRDDLEMFSSLPDLKEIVLDETFNLDVGIRFKSFVSQPIRARIFFTLSAYGSE